MRTASVSDVGRVQFVIQISNRQDLSARARAYLGWFVALAKMGFNGLAVPVGAITRGQQLCGGRYTSDRSTYLALAELEKEGFFHRSKYRIGKDHFRTVITFNAAAFAYWTGRRVANVSPIGGPSDSELVVMSKGCDKVGYVQGLQETPVTSTPVRSYSCNSTVIKHASLTRAIDINTGEPGGKAKPVHKWLPVLFTLRCLLGSPRHPGVILGQLEADGAANVSGVDWGYWGARWPELTIADRERTANREIVPLVLDALDRRAGRARRAVKRALAVVEPKKGPPMEENTEPEKTGSGVSAEQVSAAIAALCARFGNDAPPPPPPKPIATPIVVRQGGAPPCQLSREEIEILEAAAAKARSRQNSV